MAEFYASVTTDAGIALAADLLVGEKIIFTKLVTGSGIYEADEITRTSLQKVTKLKAPQQEFGFSSITKETDSCVLLKSLLSNVELTEGYRMTEIGIYAKKQEDEENEILYSLSVAKEADYFPRYNGIAAIEIIEDYYITVSDVAEVSIQTGKGAVALLEDFEKFREEMRKKMDEMSLNVEFTVSQKMIDLQKQIGDLTQLMTENKGCLVDAINEIAEVIRPLIEYGIATDQDIDDIIMGIYADDIDWVTTLNTASDRDIDAIISGMYEDDEDEGDEEGIATDDDIDAIISGTYIDEPEDEEMEDVTQKEIDNIIENSFEEGE